MEVKRALVKSAILAPDGAPGWVFDPGQLWNTVERSEKRVDAQLAREIILAVPPELSPAEQFQTAADWAKKELVGSGMVAEISLHHPASGTNPHVHIMALLAGTADFIQEFDRVKWPKPLDAKAPVIESIEVVVQDTAQPAAQTGHVSL
jgi:hypothetical protein